MGKALSSLGGLLGGKIDKPKAAPKPQETQIDPDRSKQIAAARRKQQELSLSAGRSAFRIDLGSGAAAGGGQTRSGITIS